MLWNYYISVTPSKNDMLIEAKGHSDVQCIGSSCQIIGGHSDSNSFLTILTKDINEVIVVTVTARNSNGNYTGVRKTFLIGIEWKDNIPFIDNSRNFVSFATDRHIAISGDDLDALIDGKIYTSRTDNQGDYVIDADTLCKYAALKIDADKVKLVAKEIAEEQSLVDKLKQELTDQTTAAKGRASVAQNLVDRLQREIHAREIEVDEVNLSLTTTAHEIDDLQNDLNNSLSKRDTWRTAAQKLLVVCTDNWKVFPIPNKIAIEMKNINDLSNDLPK
ncbi:MAG: hypothetical protein ACKUBY_00435 [Candidatus Moraniibacteriota bacterium]|jgi:hypothetical protein